LQRLAACIDRGLEAVQKEQKDLRREVKKIHAVADTLDPAKGSAEERRSQFEKLRARFSRQSSPFGQYMAKIMASFVVGLFVVPLAALPQDNLDLERWFRLPKSHERRIHGRRHAGTRLVQEGPTLAPTLDAHLHHPDPFTADELVPYRCAQPPPSQKAAIARRRIARSARSSKLRPVLLAELERRYLELP
jgi:hypothetical protein